ncbi:MAG: chromosome segregation protein SMC [Oscillospiraceae bacterium]|nr:chromosome segregation protein SMC [Oscillospiraceae bacterium]
MYLKSLEIQGFKSFPDKVNLTFDKGLTAVVGPNGSGKSNIGDSVRWVLGEQSTKTLRGSKMEDVIFSGTVSRKAMGFASVTINIDNSDRTIEDYDDEISVTRKLYRSGESEYKINGKSVRLKDISELFMDTGLGRDGYSIIGQGRIAEIVSARSTERRSIFEEASGISKFRYKKQESERKLESAQENIIRLTDIISELESRIEPLKQQSEKAKKFIELADKQRKLEISVWVYRLNELKSRLEEIQSAEMIKSAEYRETEENIKVQEEKIQSGYRSMQESTIKSDSLRQKILEEEQYSSNIKSDIAVYENDILHSNESIRTISEKRKTDLKSYNSIISEIKKIENKLLETENLIKDSVTEAENLSGELRSIETETLQSGEISEKASEELNSLYIKQSEYKFNIEFCKNSIESAKALKSELEKSVFDNKEKFENLIKSERDIKSGLDENVRKINEISNKLAGTEKLYNIRKSAFEEAKTKLEKIFFDIKSKKQRKKFLEDLENNMEGFSHSVKLILKAVRQKKLNRVHGTVAQLIDVEPKYSIAIETVLGNAMQNIIVENEETAKQCIKFLKDEKGGRATFLPVTSVKARSFSNPDAVSDENFLSIASDAVKCRPEHNGIIKSLLGNTAIAENIDTASVLARKYGYKFRVVTLDGQLINAGGSFTGGSPQRSAGIFTRRNELEQLEYETESLDKQRQKIAENAEKLRLESEHFKTDSENLKYTIQNLEAEKIRLEIELKNISENVISFEKMIETENFKSRENEKKILNYTENLELSEKSLADTEKRISDLEKDAELQQNKNDILNKKRRELSEKISDLKIQKATLEKDVELFSSEIERLNQSRKEISENITRLDDDILNHKKLIDEKKSLIIESRKKLENFKSNSGEYLKEIENLHKIHDEQSMSVRELQKGLKEINIFRDKLLGEVTRLKERYEITMRDFDNIVSQLLETYELTRSDAVSQADKIDDIFKAQKNLSEIKNKIKALGNVNVESVEEYRQVSERYEFLSAQLEDVRSSKKELEKIIADLTDDMCRIFSESFDIINKNFKVIFKELFGGGKAELILAEPENVLESGIEISVAPPGKVIKNLISLSGGEQSFVAIAIYFAILKLRPSPFCILDEIDAALDESNVARYAQYLKKFTDTTQFVLVTHRRSAMEEANVLYGVTMQEDGISKLLKMEQVDVQ